MHVHARACICVLGASACKCMYATTYVYCYKLWNNYRLEFFSDNNIKPLIPKRIRKHL